MISALLLIASAQSNQLQVDPLLIVQAAEVWSVIGRSDNPVWPGWDARGTPIVLYFPGKQDVLINHPKPPEGFVKYTGPVQSPIGPIYIKNGATIKDLDGQNTSTEVGGVGTLVVADTLSSRRQWLESLAGRKAEELPGIINEGLLPNPYETLALIAHEAFHVYQGKMSPNKGANELAVLTYPSLSVENNVGFALESDFLAHAAKSANPRQEAVKWLAVRQWRRGFLPKESSAYEDGNEFNEGLAKYIEYKLLESLEAKTPSKEMWLVQGFRGYDNLESERDRLIERVKKAMSGEMDVNNDRFGASPVRFRLYFSGMAAAVLLDRLGAKWHDEALESTASLTELVEQQVKPTPGELKQALSEILASARFKDLTKTKQNLAKEGEAHIREVMSGFDKSPGELEIDYSKLSKPRVGFGFTPFGVLRVDNDRTIFRLLPITGLVGNLMITEDGARPVFHDKAAKIIRYQLTAAPEEAKIKSLVGDNLNSVNVKSLKLAGVELSNLNGSLLVSGRKITVVVTD